jgi:hypothetical protein
MGFFRKQDETLNEQLLREAGLAEPEPEQPPHADPAQDTFGLWTRALARPAQYDTMVTAHAPELQGDRVEFAALSGGDLIVDVETGDADLAPLADAVEKHQQPPYRAVGRRQEGDLWAVAAREIDVLRFSFAGGDGIEVVQNEGTREVRVDGEPWQGEIPALEAAGEELGDAYVVHADRLDGDLWEIQASAL